MSQQSIKIDKENCTGCFACFNVCPKSAIEMVEDVYGNVYPRINEEKCVDCGLCKKICPQLNNNIKYNKPSTAYAMHVIDSKKRSESTSGGAASLFCEEVIKQNGVAYGAANLLGNGNFEFIRIDSIDELYKIKGSKYVHCYIKNIYKVIKEDLNTSKKVLFIGTPCQVAGLKAFLRKDYENLTTVDIICHGVPSQKLLFDEIKENKIDVNKVFYVVFRDSSDYVFKLLDKNKKVLLEKKAYSVDYCRNFLKGYIFRENCYDCKYARRERVSDITIGDFWGLSKDSIVFDDESKGISLMMPSTKKGSELIDRISDNSVIEERTINEACSGNAQLNHSMRKNKEFNIYKNKYPVVGYKKTMRKIFSIKDRIKVTLKKILRR